MDFILERDTNEYNKLKILNNDKEVEFTLHLDDDELERLIEILKEA